MKLATVIVHYGSLATTETTLRSLVSKIQGATLYLVNNTVSDISSLTKIIPHTILIDSRSNRGFAYGVNLGISQAVKAGADAVLLLNNDLTWSSGTLVQLTRLLFSQPKLAIVTPLLHHRGGYDWGASLSRFTGLTRHQNWPNAPKTVLAVTQVSGAAMLIKTSIFKETGYLDERFFMYYEDVDFCQRVNAAGYHLRLSPDVVLEHALSLSSTLPTRTLQQWRSHLSFVFKYFGTLIYPTAIFVDLLLYPLFYIKSFFKKS